MLAPLAAIARHLEATKGRIHAALSAVQSDLAGADARANPPRVQVVLGPDIRGKPIWRVVGNLHGLLLVVVGENAKHGSKNLLARDGHVVVDVRENRRLDEVSLAEAVGPPGSTDHHLGAFGNAFGDVAFHAVKLN